MVKKDPTRDALNRLRTLDQESSSEAGVAQLRKLLGHRSNHVVGRAAKLAGEWRAESLIPELLAAFARFLDDPTKTDPGCAAKLPVIEALDTLEYSDPEVYLRGVRCFQHESVWGGTEDTAAGVRGASGHALINCGYPDAYLEMASLVRDREARTRRMAMESLGGSGAYQAELLLRVAVLAGDDEPDIVSLGLQGLMQIAPERSLAFVRDFMNNPDPIVAEGAALAIGEARLPESFPILKAAWNSPRWSGRCALLALPIALTREDAAFAFLLGVIRDERDRLAAAAIKALAIYAGQPERVNEIQTAVDCRGSRELAQVFKGVFEG